MRAQRVASTSSAVRAMGCCALAHSSRWAVLPPGAAQASSTRSARPAGHARPCSSKGAARWAARSCTDTQPSLHPGRRCTGWGWRSSRPQSPTGCASKSIAASACWYWASVVFCRFTRSAMGACCWLAATMACHCVGQSWRSRCSHQAGWLLLATGSASTVASSASRSRRKRRRQALTKPAWRATGPRLAASTAWFTRVKGA